MIVGLGSGTTARYFVEGLGRRVSEGLMVTGVPTSRTTADLARFVGIPLTDDVPNGIDVAVDGADEIDPDLQLVKGRGGALVREKLVAAAARRFIVIADDSKLVSRLGVGPLPVELLPFLREQTQRRLEAIGASCQLRDGPSGPFVTDNGNVIVDLGFSQPLADPREMATRLKQTLGVVDHGIFIDLADACVIASEAGVTVMESKDRAAVR